MAKDNGLTLLPCPGSLTLASRNLSRDTVVQYLRLAALDGDPGCQTWLHVWDHLRKWEQKHATLDDVCAAAGVSPVRILKAIVGAAYEAGVDVANFLAAVAHPDVVAKGIEVAKTDSGWRDREALYLHHKFMPVQQSTVINVTAQAGVINQAQNAADDHSVPSFLEDVEATVEPRETVQRLLTDVNADEDGSD